MSPVIGITTYEDQAAWRGWNARAVLLPYAYVDSVRAAGGRAVLLPPGGSDAEARETVAGLDGLVVSGGPDIDPSRYGAARHPKTQPPVHQRDSWDLALTASALSLGVPLLAICRGMQALNVCRGGTLHQHVEEMVGHTRHNGPTTGFGQHSVQVAEGSLLASILPSGEYFDVPTHHHQAVDLVGDGLTVVAWEEDGLVEAIEAGPTELGGLSGFVLGVQWHPEQGDDLRLFQALVAAATKRTGGGEAGRGGRAATGVAQADLAPMV